VAFSVVATVTDIGRQKLASGLITGKSFQVDQFEVGSGGHDPFDPATALTPDPTLTALPSSVFGPEPVDAATLVSEFCPEFTARLAPAEAIAPLSNIGLIGTIVYSPLVGDPDIGTTFLFAVGNFPLRVKTDVEQLEFRVTVQF
jgi:hypothetical protein